jgi:signal transduction histidine kinase
MNNNLYLSLAGEFILFLLFLMWLQYKSNKKLEKVKNELLQSSQKINHQHGKLLHYHEKLEQTDKKLKKSQLKLSHQNGKLEYFNDKLEIRIKDELAKNDAQQNIMFQQSKMASMGEMLGNISHQWRQPLNVLALKFMNFNRKYKKDKLTDEFIEDFIEKSRVVIEAMSSTIDDFKDFYKPDKEKTIFCINTAINNSIAIVIDSFRSKYIEINLKYDENIQCDYLGYKNEFSQVILNILNNAKDAIVINNIDNGYIDIDIIQKEDRTEVILSDNAGGIPDDIINKIFEPYFTTKDDQGGTGIGMYMSKIIVENSMNGEFKVSNYKNADTEEVGARFYIILPTDSK